MKWATRELIHLDRVASAWLILRFIDPDAEFAFLAPDEQVEPGTVGFGIPGSRFGTHEAGVTCFHRLRIAHALEDAALVSLDRLLSGIVDCVLADERRAKPGGSAGLLEIVEGVMLLSLSDRECLEKSLLIYDAILARLAAAPALHVMAPECGPLEEARRLARAVGRLRGQGRSFSAKAFSECLDS